MNPADQRRFDEALKRHRGGRPDLAWPVYTELRESYPDDAEISHLMGVVAFQKGDLEAAAVHVQRAVELNDQEPKYFDTLGVIHLEAGDPQAAERVLREAIAIDPSFADAHYNLGTVFIAQGRSDAAEAAYRQTIELDPRNAEAYHNLGGILKAAGQREEAINYLRRADQLAPGNSTFLLNLTDCLERLSLTEEATGAAKRLLEAVPHSELGNILMARIERRAGDLAPALSRLERVAASATELTVRTRALFDLGHVLDLLNRHEEAFQAFARANGLVEESLDAVRRAKRLAFVEAIGRDRAWFTPERLDSDALPSAGGSDAEAMAPIFMVGFPRSGTTLFEQILEAHPDLTTSGELSPLAVVKREIQQGGAYPDCLESPGAPDMSHWRRVFFQYAESVFGERLQGRWLVDKAPLNILDIGLIGRVFPEAHVVVSLRDPRDVCLSCFMQQFKLNNAMSNFTSLDSTVNFYVETMNLWLYMREHTRLKWLEYRYEDLTDDFAAVTRRVLEFLGVPWNDGILEYRQKAVGRDISTPSYHNVAEPMYGRAKARWRRYEAQTATALEPLAPFVEAFGYGDV